MNDFYGPPDPRQTQANWGAEAAQPGPGMPATLQPLPAPMPPIPSGEMANQHPSPMAQDSDLLAAILSSLGLISPVR